jgi:exosome complex component CSL4
MAEQGRIVLPGDEVAVAEEFEAGEGTFEEHGRIYAAQPGHLELDAQHRVARVAAFNPPAHLRVDEVIYGAVDEVRASMVEARVLAVHGRDRQVAGVIAASLHVSKISNAYVENIRDVMRLGDIIRARVIQTEPSLQVTTAEANLGVVLALCANCRGPMERAGADRVRCPKCERTDSRKLTADYGTPELSAPIPRVEEPGGERRPRPEREGDDRRGGGRGRGPPRGGGRDRGERGGGDRGGRRSPRRDRRE